MVAGTTYNNNGYFTFDGIGERDGDPTGSYITLNTTSTTTDPIAKPAGVTYDLWLSFTGEQVYGHSLYFGSGTINHLEWKGSLAGGYFRTEAILQNGYSFGAPNTFGGFVQNNWYNLTIVFANAERTRPVRWYMDGVLFHTGSMTGGTSPDTEYFIPSQFGRATGTIDFLYSSSFKGNASVWRFYDNALTDSQVSQNYNATKSRYK
jgi:hypothetical protein